MGIFKKDEVFLVSEVENGQIYMRENVFKDIAVQSYLEEMGLEEDETKNKSLVKKLMPSIYNNCKVKIRKEDAFIVDVSMKVFFGVNIPTIARKVRNRIINDFNAMTGIEKAIVNIHIEGFLDMDKINKGLS